MPPTVKYNTTTDSEFRPCSSSVDSDEDVIVVDVTIVVSVTIFVNLVANGIFLEAELSQTLVSKIYKKSPTNIIICSEGDNFHKITKADFFPSIICILIKVSDCSPMSYLSKKLAEERRGRRIDSKLKEFSSH